jgi:hypothetical protein
MTSNLSTTKKKRKKERKKEIVSVASHRKNVSKLTWFISALMGPLIAVLRSPLCP